MEQQISDHGSYAYTGGKAFVPPTAGEPAVVFIHGAAQDHSCWSLQSRWFAHHGYAVLAPDLPGHGRSGGAPLPTVAAVADWVIALLDAAGVEKAMLIGHSMGSLAALDAASRYPERVSSLVLIGTSVPMPVSDALLDAARNDEPRAMSMINNWSHSQRGHCGGNTVPGFWMHGVNRRLMERQNAGVIGNDLNACNSYLRGTEAAAAVRCPVLIVAGSRDLMTPTRNTKALAAMLPQAQVVTLPGAGHAMMAEQPDALLDALIGFARV